tara:strand:- start:252 stop:479 length:228 start_codon:yes stop_codon:yes gene_type:complete
VTFDIVHDRERRDSPRAYAKLVPKVSFIGKSQPSIDSKKTTEALERDTLALKGCEEKKRALLTVTEKEVFDVRPW